MISTSLDFDSDVIEGIQQALGKFPSLMGTALKRQEGRLSQNLRKRFVAAVPGPPRYPFVWSLNHAANMRARRWYFANRVPKGSRGGTYQRTGKLVKSYEVTIKLSDLENNIMVSNPSRGELYTLGERQIYGHQRTGWPKRDDIIADFAVDAQNIVVETWYTVVDEFAGAKG